MSDIQQKIQEDKTKFSEDYSESVDWYTELATSAPVTAGEMIVNLRAQLREAREAALRVVGESGWISNDFRHEVLKEMTDAFTHINGDET